MEAILKILKEKVNKFAIKLAVDDKTTSLVSGKPTKLFNKPPQKM